MNKKVEKKRWDPVDMKFWTVLAIILVLMAGAVIIHPLAVVGDFGPVPKAVLIPAEGVPNTVTQAYYHHVSDFQRYAVNDLFMEFAANEPSGIISTESDPMYVGGKSLMKTTQSGYMLYGRWKDIKPTRSWVQYNEIIRFPNISGSAYSFMTWQEGGRAPGGGRPDPGVCGIWSPVMKSFFDAFCMIIGYFICGFGGFMLVLLIVNWFVDYIVRTFQMMPLLLDFLAWKRKQERKKAKPPQEPA